MIKMFLGATSGLALLSATAPAIAQHSGHGGMTMPMPATEPAAKKPAAKKKVVAKKPVAKKSSARSVRMTPAMPPAAATPPDAVDHSTMDHGQMNHAAPAPVSSTPVAPVPVDHSQMNHGPVAAAAVPAVDHAAMGHGAAGGHADMRSALGNYRATRIASGTAWQPDSSEHSGWMMNSGDWDFMVHGNLDLIADTQSGRRGDDKIFAAGMLMGMATRQFANGNALQFRGMISPDPLMGKSGYPLLLASGETANGTDRLIDRQHPHDFFMELSASYSVKLADKASAFVYAGLPGEPAFGPPAFMHRQSISASPEAPITHHWLDSTHITFGVVTAGLVVDRFKVEASRFNGREPDEKRWDIETGPLDSSSLRVSWNPTANLSLQGSWAHLAEPEQLEPGINQRRWSASAHYTRPMTNGWWATTLAWGRKSLLGEDYDAFALESSIKRGQWTVFGRGEIAENNELLPIDEEEEEGGDHHGEAFTVAKVSLGIVRDFKVAEHLALGVGGLYSLNFVPKGLKDEYGGRNPHGAMGFVRLKIQ
ncbi:MAG: hypothetical protein ABI617_05700 [Sphingomicrobium sp.]